YHGLAFLPGGKTRLRVEVDPAEAGSCLRYLWLRLRDRNGVTFVVAAPRDPSATILRHLGVSGGAGNRVIDVITSPTAVRALIDSAFSDRFTENAIWTLERATPGFSAHKRLAPWQGLTLVALGVGFASGLWLAPAIALNVTSTLLAGIFLLVSIFRLGCFFAAFAGRRPLPRPPKVAGREDRNLPVYTVLVPLYREADIVDQTVAALLALDYPRTRLDIKLVLEEDDTETLDAVGKLDLPGCVEVVIVPTSWPRTKPKAMNYALARARGSLVAVFDAEDIPQPSQLRIAARAFSQSPEKLACLQCRLGFYNAGQNWLTRQFAIEYAALFDVILPALDRLGLPMMLGGTSNHFRTFALVRAGGWDAFNVTEDADLGFRLARLGYKCGWLNCLTLEEAAAGPRNWFAQRQRWLQGWIQTYFVHMKNPLHLFRQLGAAGFVSFQAIVGGIVLSAMAYPIFLGQFVWFTATGTLFLPLGNTAFDSLLLLNAINLLFGFGIALELAIIGLYRSGQARLLWQIPLLPIYWLGTSLASYFALWRFIRRPFEWKKTAHTPIGQIRKPMVNPQMANCHHNTPMGAKRRKERAGLLRTGHSGR
ncbi:MAG: glycosyltransferase, partial [Hyphomicrobiales bacterium]